MFLVRRPLVLPSCLLQRSDELWPSATSRPSSLPRPWGSLLHRQIVRPITRITHRGTRTSRTARPMLKPSAAPTLSTAPKAPAPCGSQLAYLANNQENRPGKKTGLEMIMEPGTTNLTPASRTRASMRMTLHSSMTARPVPVLKSAAWAD